ncbi:hypothetical protein D9M68_17510 [compost metagenome]
MKVTDIFSGGRAFGFFWIAVSLGSCSIVQHIDNSTTSFFTLGGHEQPSLCPQFTRTVRVGHVKPKFPKVDLNRLSPTEVNDVLLTYAERLKDYIADEDKFIAEDILRYNDSCKKDSLEFLKKDRGYNMGAGEVSQLSKVQ